MASVQVEFEQTFTRVLAVAEETQEDVEGYMFTLGGEMQFVAKEDADDIARFILFGDQPVDPEPEPAPEEPVQ